MSSPRSKSGKIANEPYSRQGDRWLSPLPFAGFLALTIFAFFPDVVLGQSTFVFRDFGGFGYPLAAYHRASFWRGELPLWNPLNNCGVPFLAQWNTLVLYPGSLIYLLLPMPMSLNWFCLVHLLAAGIGMHALARRWTGDNAAASVAGIGFALNGLTLHALMWPNNIAALGWMPWVILAADGLWVARKNSLYFLATVGTLQMLTGAPEIIACTWFFVLLSWTAAFIAQTRARKTLLTKLVLAIVIIAGLAAAQLIPFFDLLLHSERDRTFGAQSWAMPAWGWLNLLVPAFRCYASPVGVMFQSGQFWTSSYYPGIGVLALAVSGAISNRQLQTRFVAGAAALGLVLALGETGILYRILRTLVPAFGWMRFPIKFVVLSVFAVPVLAALGLASSRHATSSSDGRGDRLALWVGAGFSLIILLVIGFARLRPYPDENWNAVLSSGASRFLFLGGTLLAIRFLRQDLPALIYVSGWIAFLIFLAADALTHTPRQNPMVELSVFNRGLSAQQFDPAPRPGEFRAMLGAPTYNRIYGALLPDLADDYRSRRLALFGNCNLLDAIPTVQGLYSLNLPDYNEIKDHLMAASGRAAASPLMDVAGILFVTDPVEMFEWKKRERPLPIMSIGQEPVFVDSAAALAGLQRDDFDPRKTVYLPAEASGEVAARASQDARIVTNDFSPQHVFIRTQSPTATMLFVSQTSYHPWQAFLDGKRARIWKANYAFQAIEVPAGSHTIHFDYVDRGFQCGLMISLFTLLGCLALSLIGRKRSV